MAGLWCESFDRLSVATLAQKYVVTTAGLQIDAAYGRYGRGMRLLDGNDVGIRKLLTVTRTQAYFGFAVNPRSPNGRALAGLAKDGTNRFAVIMNGNGQIHVGGATLSTLAVQRTLWSFVEVHATLGIAGTCAIAYRINGVAAGSYTGLTLGADFNELLLGSQGFTLANGEFWLDDYYLLDTTGAANNTWLGDRRVFSVRVNGAGSLTQMTPVGAGTNHGCTGDDISDGDTTYVQAALAADSDLYTKETVTDAKNIAWAQINGVWRSDDASSLTARLLCKSGATTAESADLGMSNSYINGHHIQETDPNTGAAWGVAAFNAAEIGPKRTL